MEYGQIRRPGPVKFAWSGTVVGVQPRILMTRSFDQVQHSYQGYTLRVRGPVGEGVAEFAVGIGKAAQKKHALRVGDEVHGMGEPVHESPREIAAIHSVSGLAVVRRAAGPLPAPPPFTGLTPLLEVYRERGHRRLAAKTFHAKCHACQWGCEMPVEMIIDHWNPSVRRHRRETFCYGPKSCAFYAAGPTRKVPGRKGMSWEEEDWVDEENTSHRGDDE